MHVKIKKLENSDGLELPKYATSSSAGQDLVAAVDQNTILKPGEWKLIPTGIAMALSAGYEAQVRPRSGLAYKHGVTVLNTPGTIDADYRGEVKVILINLGKQEFVVERGMRIAQMIIAEYAKIEWNQVPELEDSERGAGGFGSTGVKSG